jgi:hypothetical protein
VESIDRGEKNTKLKQKEGEKLHVGASLDTLQMSTFKKGKDKYPSTAWCGQITQRQKVGVSLS